MKFLLLMSALAFVSCSSWKPEKKDNLADINLDVKEVTLDNGLTALIIPDHKLPIFSLYLFYKVGGKNEVPGITGASHFLEHMMFKGAKKFGKNSIDFIIEGSGGSTNAYTTTDQTVYYENLPTSQLEQMLEIEADRMENLLLDENDFEKERAVVLEERRMRYENSPRGQLYLGLMSHLFEGTPYGRSVIGDIADLKTMTREQIYQYFKKFYAPNNVVVVIAGDVNPRKAKEYIKKYFGHIKSSPTVEEAHEALKDEDFIPKFKQDKVVKLKGESPSPIFMMGYPTYKAGHKKGYALDVLSSIIGSGKSSSLVNDYILTKKPVATSIYAAHQSLEKSGFFFLGGELVQGINLDHFKKDLKNKLKSYCSTEITERNIQKVKNNFQTDLYASLDNNAGIARFLGNRQLLFGDWKFYQEELAEYEKVTVEDVKQACEELVKTPSVFISVWNKHK
ncbi:MAG TPA: pitrilysin family protein [Bacteriovoracaceae bacterium]|nr:pitrilysin family protein [Bacteriovoracaceae bacterium]